MLRVNILSELVCQCNLDNVCQRNLWVTDEHFTVGNGYKEAGQRLLLD